MVYRPRRLIDRTDLRLPKTGAGTCCLFQLADIEATAAQVALALVDAGKGAAFVNRHGLISGSLTIDDVIAALQPDGFIEDVATR